MDTKIYTIEEAAMHLGLEEALLEKWLQEGVVETTIVADGTQPLFTTEDFPLLEKVNQLHEMGYSTDEIRKISRKIGLPGATESRKKHEGVRNLFTVGELANSSGVNVRTVKYWEERGLIQPTSRSEGGFRLYDERVVSFCRQIQDLQLFSYSLDEIGEIIGLFGSSDAGETRLWLRGKPDAQTVERAAEILEDMGERIRRLSLGVERWRKRLRNFQNAIYTARKQMKKWKAEAKPVNITEENPSSPAEENTSPPSGGNDPTTPEKE